MLLFAVDISAAVWFFFLRAPVSYLGYEFWKGAVGTSFEKGGGLTRRGEFHSSSL